jgi:hypothetical protein
MKHQNSSIAVWKMLVVAAAVVALAGFAGSALAATPSQITVRDQDLNTGVVTLDSVTAPQDGWVVVYNNPDFTDGAIVGYAPVHQGVNNNVKVTIDRKQMYADAAHTALLPSLWARLHTDNPVKGLFEWGLRNLPYNDPPVIENGHEVVTEFGTWAGQ